ncbi:MAG: transcriptional activator domain protein [Ilumatobacteraceae bacterium]|nr:transcriptional activator domain protein [Ilumatobacteraceae bacterium]
MVSAGAGFGKTTLLTQALAENALDPLGRDVYLGCQPEDASASTLLAGLLAGLGVPVGETEGTIDALCAAVWSAAPVHVCFTVDDAHAISAGSAGEHVLAELVERLPANGHLVVASRRTVAISTSRLRAVGRCDSIDEDDLRLDDDELAFLAAGHGIDAGGLGGIGGWPALAELTAVAGEGVAAAFVSEEVLAALEPAVQHQFALIVAIGGGDAATIAAVCDDAVDVEPLSTLPLVSVDRMGTIRPHSLWADLLRGRLSASEVAAARRAAARALREQGANVAAFELLAAAQDWDAALPVLFDACNDQVTPPWADVMERWRSLVPAALDHAPEMAYLRAMIDRSRDTWMPSVVEEFATACSGFAERGDIAREVAALVRACSVAVVCENRDWMAMARARGVTLIDAGVPVHATVLLNDVWRAYADGRFEDVLEMTDIEPELEPRLRHFPAFYRFAAMLGLGRADAAREVARRLAELGGPVVPAFATGWATSAPAFVALACGDLPAITSSPINDLGPRFGLSERVPHLAVGAIGAANSGDVATAAAALGTIDELRRPPARRGMIDGFRALAAAAVALADHDESAATAALADALDDDLTPVGAGMAMRWYPAHPYLFHPPSRALLDAEPSGASRQRILDLSRALLRSRDEAAAPIQRPALLDEIPVVIAAFGVPLAVECVVRLGRPGADSDHCIATLIDCAPEATRRALRDLVRSKQPALASTATTLLSKLPIPPPHVVRLEVLGPPRLLRDGVAIDDVNWRRARVRQLLTSLAVFRRVRRQRVGVMMWPDGDEASVSANLRMTLSYVQALLEPHRSKGDAPWFVRQESGALVLEGGGHLAVDIWEFDDAIDRAADARQAAIPSAELEFLLVAIDLWRGEPLADLSDLDWAGAQVRRLEERYVVAVVRAAELLAAAGRDERALEIAERGLQQEPWSEGLHRVVIATLIGLDDPDPARRALNRCRSALAELDLPLSPGLAQLVARVEAR